MYAVSQELMDAMRAQRRQVLAKVVIDYTDPLIDQSIHVDASERARISWPEQTADGLTQAPYMWASLDGSWTLDQFRRPMPDTQELVALYQVGWWGEQLAGTGGAFAAPYPTLTIAHTPRPIHSLRVVGENQSGEYPADFAIRLKDELGTILHEEIVTDNTEIAWSKMLDAPVLDVASQELEIHKWSHEGRQAKILEFFSSVQQTHEDDLIAVSLLEEREVSQGSLPVGNISSNEIVVRLSNEDKRFDPDNDTSPLYGLIKPNRRVRAWLGTEIGGQKEWVPLGTFWSIDWDTQDDMLEAQVRARDRLELLRKSTFQPGAVEQNASLYALAEAVLKDAGLKTDEYAIDESMQDIIIPWAWLPSATHRDALRIVAEAGLAVCYCGRDGKINVAKPAITEQQPQDIIYFIQGAPFPAEFSEIANLHHIGPDDYFSPLRTPSRQDEVANEIVVTTQPLKPADAAQEVYRSNTSITIPAGESATVTARYNQPPVIGAVASLDSPPVGVSIVNVAYYAWGAEVTIENAGEEIAEAVLVVTGKPLSVQGGEQVIVRDQQSIIDNGALRYEFPANPLVQTLAQAQAIATGLLASAKIARRDVEMEWRGNPALELGDPISVLTDAQRDRRSDYAIIRQEIDWAGYLRARLTGRRIT
jgi:hypothetical protein